MRRLRETEWASERRCNRDEKMADLKLRCGLSLSIKFLMSP